MSGKAINRTSLFLFSDLFSSLFLAFNRTWVPSQGRLAVGRFNISGLGVARDLEHLVEAPHRPPIEIRFFSFPFFFFLARSLARYYRSEGKTKLVLSFLHSYLS